MKTTEYISNNLFIKRRQTFLSAMFKAFRLLKLYKIYGGDSREIKEKVLTVKLPGESHRRLKVLASSEGLSIKSFLMNIPGKDAY
ncbi:MAG TPA: hypothetical protein PL110_03910 [Candidatus Eremiobacteraeota bacterium]|nr:hypothetical protein [Candidatus Eremiobacteraeota bacterium]